MKDFFYTLLRPDHKEKDDAERAEVAKAANYLQVGEFQLLQLSYYEWHGEDLPRAQIDRIFGDYMLRNVVLHWARHYARNIIELERSGELDDNDPAYHRYDHDYVTYVPGGKGKFITVASLLFILIFGAIGLSAMITTGNKNGSILPPYFNEEDDSKKNRAIPLP